MTFGFNPLIVVTFLRFELSHFMTQLPSKHIDFVYLVNATPPTILPGSFSKLCSCSCQGLKMCMTFGPNPQTNSCNIFRSLNLVYFGLNSTEAYRHWVSCELNSSYNFPVSF